MGYEKIRAIIFDTKPTGEHDKYLEMITEDGRRISAKIRKARHTNSKWGARTEPVTIVDLELYEKQSRYTVTGISSAENFPAISEDYEKLVASKYISEVIIGTTPYDVPEEDTFQITAETFKKLAVSENVLLTVNEFLARIIISAGYPFELEYCPVCGEKVSGQTKFSLEECSVVCLTCTSQKLIKLPDHARIALQKICYEDSNILDVNKKLLTGIHTLLERLIYHRFNCKPRSSLHLRGL